MLGGALARNSTPANSRRFHTPARTAGDTAKAIAKAVIAATSAVSQRFLRRGALIRVSTLALRSGGSGTWIFRPRSRRAASVWSSIMGHLLQHRAQLGQCAGQPRLHGSLGEVEGLRGLGLAQVQQVPARDDLAV